MSAGHRIVLTGGGTGGHIYPALAVAEKLCRDESVEAILYCGVNGHLEERLALARGLAFEGFVASGLPRQLSIKLLTWPGQFMTAVKRALEILRNFKATVVFGTGGYASAPLLMAASWLQIPFAIHEPDSHPGLVNRLFGNGAALISLGMEGARQSFLGSASRVVINGNPVSEKFLNAPSRKEACQLLDLDASLQTVLVTGGSQGARAVNLAVFEALPELLLEQSKLQIVHQVGQANWIDMKEALPEALQNHPRYKPHAYFDNLAIPYAACDLTVCRAGAMTIAELFITGTPAIFVPLPSAAQDHQTFNAHFVEGLGAAKLLAQKDLNGRSLAQLIRGLLENQTDLDKMSQAMRSMARPDAAERISAQLRELSGRKLGN